jgi:hypothetical protein
MSVKNMNKVTEAYAGENREEVMADLGLISSLRQFQTETRIRQTNREPSGTSYTINGGGRRDGLEPESVELVPHCKVNGECGNDARIDPAANTQEHQEPS